MQRSKLKIGDEVAVKWCGVERAVVLDFGWTSGGLHGKPQKLSNNVNEANIALAALGTDGVCRPLVVPSRDIIAPWAEHIAAEAAAKKAREDALAAQTRRTHAREARWAKLRNHLDGVFVPYGAERITLTLEQVEKLVASVSS